MTATQQPEPRSSAAAALRRAYAADGTSTASPAAAAPAWSGNREHEIVYARLEDGGYTITRGSRPNPEKAR